MAKILFFGSLADLLDIEALEVKLPPEIKTVNDLSQTPARTRPVLGALPACRQTAYHT